MGEAHRFWNKAHKCRSGHCECPGKRPILLGRPEDNYWSETQGRAMRTKGLLDYWHDSAGTWGITELSPIFGREDTATQDGGHKHKHRKAP